MISDKAKRSACCSRRVKIGISVGFVLVLTAVALIVFLVVLVNRTKDDSRTVVYSQVQESFLFAENEKSLAVYDYKGKLVESDAAPGIVVDDLSATGASLFTLDFEDGTVTQHVLAPDGTIDSSGSPHDIPARTFTGISAANDRLVVSGGTKDVTVFVFSSDKLRQLGTVDLGRGQPDVTLDASLPVAYVCTDFDGTIDGQRFGLTILDISSSKLTTLATMPLTNDDNLLDESRDFSPNFPIRAAASLPGAGHIMAVAYMEALSVFNVTVPSSPVLLVRLTASQLGFSPRAATIDEDGNVLAVGPVDRSNHDGRSEVGGFSTLWNTTIPSVQVADGVTISSMAVSNTTIALATRNGPIFVNKTQLLG